MPGTWDGTAEAYAASFALLCAGTVAPLLDELDARMPSRGTLLDVGTGPGTLARAAAARGWDVSASDPEPGMLAVAEATPGADRIRFSAAALPSLPDPDRTVDAVTANFVVNHTTRPRAAIAELVRVARGAVALTIWPRGRTVLNGLWSGIVADAGATTVPGTTLAPGDDIDRTEDGLAVELRAAGLAEVRTTTIAWDFAIPADVLWSSVAGGAGTIGTTHRAQTDEVRRRMREAFDARTAELIGADGLLHLPSAGLLGVGRPG